MSLEESKEVVEKVHTYMKENDASKSDAFKATKIPANKYYYHQDKLSGGKKAKKWKATAKAKAKTGKKYKTKVKMTTVPLVDMPTQQDRRVFVIVTSASELRNVVSSLEV